MQRVLIQIIIVSSESVHLYNRTYFLILVGDSSCDTSDSDDDVTMIVDLQGYKVCGESTLENIERQKVIKIPFDNTRMKVYSIKVTSCTDLIRRYRDGRPWKKDSRAKWTGYDTVRFIDCNAVMDHCVTKPKLSIHFKVWRKKQTEIQLFKDLWTAQCTWRGCSLSCQEVYCMHIREKSTNFSF